MNMCPRTLCYLKNNCFYNIYIFVPQKRERKLMIKYMCLFLSILFQSLLTHVSRPTKNTLNKLGVFTVSSFHAFICARSPSLLNNLLAGRGATKRRPPLLSRSNSGSSRRSMQVMYICFIIILH